MEHFAFLPLLADAGLPMIGLWWAAMVFLLVPVIVIEGLLCKTWLGLTTWQALKSNALSNLASTIVGVPLAWAIMVGLEAGTWTFAYSNPTIQHWNSPILDAALFILGSAWLGPIAGDHIWMIPAATLVLLVPFYFASYFVEYQVMRNQLIDKVDSGQSPLTASRIKAAVRNANL